MILVLSHAVAGCSTGTRRKVKPRKPAGASLVDRESLAHLDDRLPLGLSG